MSLTIAGRISRTAAAGQPRQPLDNPALRQHDEAAGRLGDGRCATAIVRYAALHWRHTDPGTLHRRRRRGRRGTAPACSDPAPEPRRRGPVGWPRVDEDVVLDLLD